MKTINKPADNLGGLIKIWAIPSPVFSSYGKTVTITDLTDVYQIYCSPESMSFREQKITDNSGIHYSSSINGFVPKDSESNLEAIDFIESRFWVVIFMDGNGNYKAVGNRWEPMKASFDLDTKSNTADRAGAGLQFTLKSTFRAYFVNNPF